jgi:hypothetical protein
MKEYSGMKGGESSREAIKLDLGQIQVYCEGGR